MAADYEVEIWPSTLEPLDFFNRVATQWRTNGHIPIGLDYTVFPMVFDLLDIDQGSRPRLFEQVRIMEQAALEQMAENRKDA